MIRVLLAESHSKLRTALLEYLIDGGTVACDMADTPEKVWSRLRHEQWDILILDIRLPGQTKLESVRALHEAYPKLPILVISFAKDMAPRHWQDAGASGFLCKANLSAELSEAVGHVSGGGKYFSQDDGEEGREEKK